MRNISVPREAQVTSGRWLRMPAFTDRTADNDTVRLWRASPGFGAGLQLYPATKNSTGEEVTVFILKKEKVDA